MNWNAFFFAVLTFVFSMLFLADLQGYFNITHSPIAQMQSYNGTVRRLTKAQLTWDRAQTGTLFGIGDTISTGENAKAKLAFYEGGELELDAGAMVVLEKNLEELKLNFVSGTGRVRITERAKNKIVVGQKLTLSGAKTTKPLSPRIEVEIVKNLPPPPASAVTPPSAPVIATSVKEINIRNPNQTLAQTATAGEIIDVGSLPPVPEVSFPAKYAVIDLSKEKIPTLKWGVSKSEQVASYEVLLRSADNADQEKIYKTKTAALTLQQLSQGKYVWSVRSVSAQGQRGPASSTRWLEVKVPSQLSKPIVLPVQIE